MNASSPVTDAAAGNDRGKAHGSEEAALYGATRTCICVVLYSAVDQSL